MPNATLQIRDLRVNPANDRHGELLNEDAAIAELFRLREAHMRSLARDIARERRLFEHPLVRREGDIYLVYDGNRRVTCLKLIIDPRRAPTADLREFFQGLRNEWVGPLLTEIECQIEDDPEIIDSILFRRHTGTQGGVGQSPWDPRAKRNFEQRTGRNDRIDVAEEIEQLLEQEDRLPRRQIPRSTLNRLLSSEATRNRLGVSALNGQFRITHERDVVLPALERVARDMAERNVVLADVWSNEDKRRYLDRLEGERLLPRAEHFRAEADQEILGQRRPPRRRRAAAPPRQQTTFIPHDVDPPNWVADQLRLRLIWEELQSLNCETFPNAVSALMRILLELTAESYLQHHALGPGDNLGQKVRLIIDDLQRRGAIDQHHHDELDRMRRGDELISVQSMQRFIHSTRFAPMPNEIIAYWLRLGDFLRFALNR